MRSIFVGAVDFSAHCLKTLLEMGVVFDSIMCPKRDVSKFNSDYFDLGEIANQYGKKVYYFNNIRDEVGYIKEIAPQVIFVLGLSQIIPKAILDIPKIGCLGSHPALLPQNRGRHPIIWAIANGLEKSGITLFWLNEGVDSGDIWAQEEFEIKLTEDAGAIYQKIKYLSFQIFKKGIPELQKGSIRRIKQDDSLSTYWRKRNKKDGEIDWRMSSKRIYDLVRALAKPYVGAHCRYEERDVKIWKVNMIEDARAFRNFEPGKIISIQNRVVTIKTGDGVLQLLDHDLPFSLSEGVYL